MEDPKSVDPNTTTEPELKHPLWMHHMTSRTVFIWMTVITFLLAAEAGFLYYKNIQLERQIKAIQSDLQNIPLPTPTISLMPITQSPIPTCRPRPPCLDAKPRCLISETSDMCPPNTTPSGSATNTCPTNGWVDCMPGPGPTKKECTPQAMDWYKANCPNFQGGAL